MDQHSQKVKVSDHAVRKVGACRSEIGDRALQVLRTQGIAITLVESPGVNKQRLPRHIYEHPGRWRHPILVRQTGAVLFGKVYGDARGKIDPVCEMHSLLVKPKIS